MQLIIVYLIIGVVVGISIYRLVRYIRKKDNPCVGCNGCDLKKEIMKNCDKKK